MQGLLNLEMVRQRWRQAGWGKGRLISWCPPPRAPPLDSALMTILMSRNFDYFLLEISNYDSSSFLKRLCGLKTHPLVFSPYFVPSEISGIRDQLFGAAQSSGSNESPAFISGAYQASACKSGRFGSNPVTPGLKIGALSAFIAAFSHCTNEYSAPTVSVALR